MRFALAALTCTLSAYGYECVVVAGAETRYGRVEVTAFAALSDKLDRVEVELMDSKTGKVLDSEAGDGALPRVQYGDYILRVHSPGFSARDVRINVARPETKVRVDLQVGAECGARYSDIAGRIRRGNHVGELWVKALALRGSDAREAPVSPEGAFVVANLDPGDYLLLVLDGAAIVHSEKVSVQLFQSQPLAIMLP